MSRKVTPPLELIEDCGFTEFNGITLEQTFNYIEIDLPDEKAKCNNKFKLLRKFYNSPE